MTTFHRSRDSAPSEAASTLHALLGGIPATAPALFAPGRIPLNFGALRALTQDTRQSLRRWRIGRGDTVALVLPQGPEMAAAFMACACSVTVAPLNPAYREDEFTFYLQDSQAKALIVEQGSHSPALSVARRLGLLVLELVPQPDAAAGSFQLMSSDAASSTLGDVEEGTAHPDDVCLVLHTSGTTSRPKLVPLLQRNVAASAQHIARSLAFTSADRGLLIMPLFHIHGLVAGLTAPLCAGASVFCPPGGFNALKFFAWMDEACPTWFTAVPTMHQALLARAKHHADVIARHPLRFMRSSSSSMPPQVIAAMESVFNAPLIEAYGMTEAAHQMAANPLPPAVRKPGTVGVAAGPEIAIMDDQGHLLRGGVVGEIVIRGANVTPGYRHNSQANAVAFSHGWFRTGDQGSLDADGYLRITGRLKEIINRGGEKISPREIDEVLMDHPAVQQVVTFALPHPKLGEDVAAAVVLHESSHPPAPTLERELQQFVRQRVAAFKVPHKIVFLTEIPKGATGKLQRIGLATQLGLIPSQGA